MSIDDAHLRWSAMVEGLRGLASIDGVELDAVVRRLRRGAQILFELPGPSSPRSAYIHALAEQLIREHVSYAEVRDAAMAAYPKLDRDESLARVRHLIDLLHQGDLEERRVLQAVYDVRLFTDIGLIVRIVNLPRHVVMSVLMRHAHRFVELDVESDRVRLATTLAIELAEGGEIKAGGLVHHLVVEWCTARLGSPEVAEAADDSRYQDLMLLAYHYAMRGDGGYALAALSRARELPTGRRPESAAQLEWLISGVLSDPRANVPASSLEEMTYLHGVGLVERGEVARGESVLINGGSLAKPSDRVCSALFFTALLRLAPEDALYWALRAPSVYSTRTASEAITPAVMVHCARSAMGVPDGGQRSLLHAQHMVLEDVAANRVSCRSLLLLVRLLARCGLSAMAHGNVQMAARAVSGRPDPVARCETLLTACRVQMDPGPGGPTSPAARATRAGLSEALSLAEKIGSARLVMHGRWLALLADGEKAVREQGLMLLEQVPIGFCALRVEIMEHLRQVMSKTGDLLEAKRLGERILLATTPLGVAQQSTSPSDCLFP